MVIALGVVGDQDVWRAGARPARPSRIVARDRGTQQSNRTVDGRSG